MMSTVMRRSFWAAAMLAMVSICASAGAAIKAKPAVAMAGPGLAGELDATHTVGVTTVRHLDKLASMALAYVDKLPAAARNDMDRKQIIAKAGFDPSTPAGWSSVGVDADSGVTVVLDDRVRLGKAPTPIVLLRVTDRARLLAALQRFDPAWTAGATVGGLQRYQGKGDAFWLGTRGDATAFFAAQAAIASQPPAGAAEFLGGGVAGLAEQTDFVAALAEAGDPTWSLWIGTRAALEWNPDPAAALVANFYAPLFPAFAAYVGTSGAMRLVASPAARNALAMIVRPSVPPPPCSAWFGKNGWAALRLSVNLTDLLAGVDLLLPPATTAKDRARLAAMPDMVAQQLGISWADIATALSGHVCIGVDEVAGIKMVKNKNKEELPNFLVLLGVRDASSADALVAGLAKLASGASQVAAMDVAGHAGYVITVGKNRFALARIDDVIVLGLSGAAIKAAKAHGRANSMATTPLAATIDGDVAFGFGMDLKPVLDAMQASGNAKLEAPVKEMIKNLNITRYAGMKLRLDGNGLVARSMVDGDGNQMVAIAGILAAIAIPQFVNYTRKAKAVEAVVALQQISRGAMAAYASAPATDAVGKPIPPQFPPAMALTPARSCCDPQVDHDGDQKCDANPPQWQAAGWQAVQFAMNQPHYYRYQTESSGAGPTARFTASAYGDLDCDGVYSTFQMEIKAAADCAGDPMCDRLAPSVLFRDHEME